MIRQRLPQQLCGAALVKTTGCSNLSALGGDERVRTDDPLLAKQVLSQLSYTPIFFYNGDAPFLRIYKTLKIKQRLKASSVI